MIKAVLFDLDGTLLDTNELIYSSFNHAFKTILNLELPREEITKLFGKPLYSSLVKYDENRVEELITTYRTYNEERHDNMCRPFKGVGELLEQLREKGIKIGIVTSKRRILAERGLVIGDLLKYIDVFITPESTDKHKPNGEPALKACEILGIEPSESLMVGDSHFDILCGKNAGTKTCGVRYTALPIRELEDREPDYFIEEALDILKILEKENEEVA